MRLSILPEPPRLDLFRRCPACNRRFGLKRETTQTDNLARKIHTYRCQHCGHQITYADRHPPHAI